MQRDVIETMVAAELKKIGRPRTQDDCCAVAARVSVRLSELPWQDERIVEVAAQLAAGVFGPAFVAADYGQKSAWIDMCERELRKALGKT
jgi:hypothetical protein